MSGDNKKDWLLRVVGPILISLIFAGQFAYAFALNPQDPTMLVIVQNLVVLVAGFWLGSSTGSKGQATPPVDRASLTQPVAPPPVVVQTGSPAVAEPAPAAPRPAARSGKGVDLIQGL